MSERRVYPREPMTAHRQPDEAEYRKPWKVKWGYDWMTDAEFAVAFRPAEHLEQLLAAAREVVERFNPERLLIRQREGRWSVNEVRCLEHLCEALRQWDAP